MGSRSDKRNVKKVRYMVISEPFLFKKGIALTGLVSTEVLDGEEVAKMLSLVGDSV